VDIAPRDWQEHLAVGLEQMVAGHAEVIYDKPGEREPGQDALIGLQRFIRQAESEVLSLNPYLVPGEPFFNEVQKLEDRGVDMAIMTNSLGSTNLWSVPAGATPLGKDGASANPSLSCPAFPCAAHRGRRGHFYDT
jgi:putative cardiolipin synthase